MVDIFRSVAEEHRRVATSILVRRALGDWGLEEDRDAVVAERLLWAQMTAEGQAAEDAWLLGVWVGRGVARVLGGVVIPDSAFGLAVDGYRPFGRGPVAELGGVGKWLWLRGYQVVSGSFGGDQVTMVIPPHRVVQESERLISAMVKAGVGVSSIGPWGGTNGVIRIRSSYDPVQGVATMDLVGLGVLRSVIGQ